jgi:hypothetical protein
MPVRSVVPDRNLDRVADRRRRSGAAHREAEAVIGLCAREEDVVLGGPGWARRALRACRTCRAGRPVRALSAVLPVLPILAVVSARALRTGGALRPGLAGCSLRPRRVLGAGCTCFALRPRCADLSLRSGRARSTRRSSSSCGAGRSLQPPTAGGTLGSRCSGRPVGPVSPLAPAAPAGPLAPRAPSAPGVLPRLGRRSCRGERNPLRWRGRSSSSICVTANAPVRSGRPTPVGNNVVSTEETDL